MSYRKNTTKEDAKKVLNLFVTYGRMRRKEVVYYCGFSDRKVRDIIKYLRDEYLPSIKNNTHLIIHNPSTGFYEYTRDVEKLKMAKAFHRSYADKHWNSITAIDIIIRRNQNEQSSQIKMEI